METKNSSSASRYEKTMYRLLNTLQGATLAMVLNSDSGAYYAYMAGRKHYEPVKHNNNTVKEKNHSLFVAGGNKMSRVKKTVNKASAKVDQDVIEFIIENRENLSTEIGYGADEATIQNGVLKGGHFKIQSAMRQAGLTTAERQAALA